MRRSINHSHFLFHEFHCHNVREIVNLYEELPYILEELFKCFKMYRSSDAVSHHPPCAGFEQSDHFIGFVSNSVNLFLVWFVFY